VALRVPVPKVKVPVWPPDIETKAPALAFDTLPVYEKPTLPPLTLIAALAAVLLLNPVPGEVIPSAPVTFTRFRFAAGELVDSNVPNKTFAPKVPLVATFIAPPVPVTLITLITGEPTAPPLILKNAGVLLMFRPRTWLSKERSTPLPPEVEIVGAAATAEANAVYAAMLSAAAVNTVLN